VVDLAYVEDKRAILRLARPCVADYNQRLSTKAGGVDLDLAQVRAFVAGAEAPAAVARVRRRA